VEAARGEADGTGKEREAIAAELGSTEGDVTTKLGQLEQEAGVKRKARIALAERVTPVTLYRRYENIRKKRDSSIAYVTDGTCSACHMRLPPMMFQKMMRGDDFDQCPSCARIIYYRPPEAAPAESPGGP
jgi:predicted  nucleic acid-binding Zn-ribbon protein